MRLKQILLLFGLLPATVVAGLPGRDITVEIVNSNRVVASTTRNTAERKQTPVNTNSRATTSRATNTRTVSSRATTTRDARAVKSRTAATGGGTEARISAENSTSARTATPSQRIVSRSTSNTVAARTATTTGATKVRSTRVAANTIAGATRARTTTTTALADTLNNKTQLVNACRNSYAQCMDNYCNILDENMGRCACSKNIANYKKTSDALKQANTALQDVAQQIQYIGLNKVQIETLFAETEAELAMSGTSDSSQIKNSLDKIKDMVVDIKTPTASMATNTQNTLDLSGLLDFSSDGTFGDIMSLFTGNNNSTASISNQRGATLYNTATARCQKSVLDSCKAQGVDSALITNAYDIQIDKDCLTYEASLKSQNEEMLITVRNAENVLQRARLAVAANKNSYDLRGCIGALENCMTDEYICGADYEYCMDPTGAYINGGEIVLGSTIHDFNKESVKKHLRDKMVLETRDGKAFGPCADVLNSCQDYTYSGGEYLSDNKVIDEYLARVIPQIKKSHDDIVSQFAQDCIADVRECIQDNSTSTTSISNTATRACKSIITTCMSALDENGTQNAWVECLFNSNKCTNTGSGGGTEGDGGTGEGTGGGTEGGGGTGEGTGGGTEGNGGTEGDGGTGGGGTGGGTDGDDGTGEGTGEGTGGGTGDGGVETQYDKTWCGKYEVQINAYELVQNQYTNAESLCKCNNKTPESYTQGDGDRCEIKRTWIYHEGMENEATYTVYNVWPCRNEEERSKYNADVLERTVCPDGRLYAAHSCDVIDTNDESVYDSEIYKETLEFSLDQSSQVALGYYNSSTETESISDRNVPGLSMCKYDSDTGLHAEYDPKIGQCGCNKNITDQNGDKVPLVFIGLKKFGADTAVGVGCGCPIHTYPFSSTTPITASNIENCVDLSYIMEIMKKNYFDETKAKDECESASYSLSGKWNASDSSCTVTKNDGTTTKYYPFSTKNFADACAISGGKDIENKCQVDEETYSSQYIFPELNKALYFNFIQGLNGVVLNKDKGDVTWYSCTFDKNSSGERDQETGLCLCKEGYELILNNSSLRSLACVKQE